MIWGLKCHQNNSPVVCDGYVKYKEAEVDRLVAMLKTNNCGGGGPCEIQQAARLGEGCLINTKNDKILIFMKITKQRLCQKQIYNSRNK